MDDKNPLKMKVSELKAELGRRGLSQTGLKFDLAQRLQTAMDVDEFGALPSMTNPSSSSSSILPVPGKKSTDHSESPPLSPQSLSDESDQGRPSDEQAQDLETAAETVGCEDAPPIEQSCLGDASVVVEATTQSEGGAAAAGTAESLTLEETLMTGCGEKGQDNQDKAVSDGSGGNVDAGITGGGGSAVVHEGGSVGGSNEETNDAEECGATAMATATQSANEETPAPSFAPPDTGRDKNDDTSDEYAGGGENALLPLLPDSTNPPAGTPASPHKGTEQVTQADKDQPATAGVDEPGDETSQRGVAKPDDDSDQKNEKKNTAAAAAATKDDTEGYDTKADETRTSRETKQGPSELVAPDSLLLCSLTERMKDREERFRQEDQNKPCEKKDDETEIRDKAGTDGPAPTKGSGRSRGDKVDSRGGGGGGGGGGGCGGDESGKGGLSPTGKACQEVREPKKTVEDVHRAKLVKRKERFMAPPPTSPGYNSLAELGTPPAGCSPRKTPIGGPGGKENSEGAACSGRSAASELAAKMARRSERFGGSSATPKVTSPKVRDPRGSFFVESEDTPEEGVSKNSPPPSEGYSFDPLPQRQKRARAPTTPPSNNDDGKPAKRRGVDRGGAGRMGEKASPGSVEPRRNSREAAKEATGEGRNVRSRVATSNGIDESPSRREDKGNPPPPSSYGKRISLGSAFVLLGVKKAVPKPSATTAAAAGRGELAPPRPPARLSRDGAGADGGASNHPHSSSPQRQTKEGRPTEQRQQRDRLTGTAVSQTFPVLGHPGSRGHAHNNEKKFLEQAAKMAERRKRFAEDPRAPSFR